MDSSNSFIDKIKRSLPPLASVKDLIRIGLYRTEQAAYMARRRKNCPKWARFPGLGIVYPRAEVVKFYKERFENESGLQIEDQPESPDGLISHSDVDRLRQK